MAENINDIILRTPSGGTAQLPSGEFEGPVYITKPLRLVGRNTTIWAKRGSVIEITARGVSIEQLRVELTEGDVNDAAIVARFPTAVRDVEVLGGVQGFGAEDRCFDVPRTVDLGTFAADSVNTFSMIVNVVGDTVIECSAPGVKISPKKLSAGRGEVTVTVSGVSVRTLLYAEMLFKSAFIRRIYLTGRPEESIPPVKEKVVYTAPERSSSLNSAPISISTSTDVVTVKAPAPVYDLPLLDMRRGQRVSLYQYVGNKCEITFTCDKPQGMDIDPYVFLLDENERSFGDKGLIFFGNEKSEFGEVSFFPTDGHVEINFEKVDYRVKKITLAYSIYAGGAGKNFRQVHAARVSVSASGSERITFTMDGLTDETTAVALEFYLYKGEWKLSAVGAGFRDGMVKLCNRYGIEVEN